MNMFRRSRVSHSSSGSAILAVALLSIDVSPDMGCRDVPDSSVDDLDSSSERINWGRLSSLACYLIVMFIVLFAFYVIHSSLYGVDTNSSSYGFDRIVCNPRIFDRFLEAFADKYDPGDNYHACSEEDEDCYCVKRLDMVIGYSDRVIKYDIRFSDDLVISKIIISFVRCFRSHLSMISRVYDIGCDCTKLLSI